MNIHDYDKATAIRTKIKFLEYQIEVLTKVKKIHMITDNRLSIDVGDYSKNIVEKQCLKELEYAEHNLVEEVRKTLASYAKRLEHQFEAI